MDTRGELEWQDKGTGDAGMGNTLTRDHRVPPKRFLIVPRYIGDETNHGNKSRSKTKSNVRDGGRS